MTRKIDIMRTSASAPEWLKISTEALHKHLKFSGELRWIVHEDTLNSKESDKCMKYIEECGLYTVVKRDEPPIGQCMSLSWLIDQTKTPYVLNAEDDYRLLKDIDLDVMYDIMENSNDVNQITFAKRPLKMRRPNFDKKRIFKEGRYLITQPYWGFPPALWRMSFIKPRWVRSERKDFHWRIQDTLRGGKIKNIGADWVMNNTKTYMLGTWKEKSMLSKNGGKLSQEEFDTLDNGYYMDNLGADQSRREGYKGKLKIKPMPNILPGGNFSLIKWRP